jgi:tRNA (cytidine/uridine-2'-O-)-methyltransferase
MCVAVALYEPEIAQNVGAILRTAVAFGVPAHLIEPMSFVWDDKRLKRAGMDYLDHADVHRHLTWAAFQAVPGRRIALTTKGTVSLGEFDFQPGDVLLFGPESRGLPDDIRHGCQAQVRIPMRPEARSLNLAQSCAMTLFEALRHLNALPR